jgi:hypothetical protein
MACAGLPRASEDPATNSDPTSCIYQDSSYPNAGTCLQAPANGQRKKGCWRPSSSPLPDPSEGREARVRWGSRYCCRFCYGVNPSCAFLCGCSSADIPTVLSRDTNEVSKPIATTEVLLVGNEVHQSYSLAKHRPRCTPPLHAPAGMTLVQ